MAAIFSVVIAFSAAPPIPVNLSFLSVGFALLIIMIVILPILLLIALIITIIFLKYYFDNNKTPYYYYDCVIIGVLRQI